MSTFEVRYQLSTETTNKVKMMDAPDTKTCLRWATQDLEARYGTEFTISQIDEMYW